VFVSDAGSGLAIMLLWLLLLGLLAVVVLLAVVGTFALETNLIDVVD
jgi:hypothetical protein